MSTQWKSQGAWVWVKWKAGSPENAWKQWQNSESQLKHGWSTTGEWDCKLWVEAENVNEIEKFVWNTVRSNQWVDKTKTNLAWQWA